MSNNGWLPYPANKPKDENIKDIFVVLSPNPNFIKKSFCNQNLPKYCAVQAVWLGTNFVNSLWQPLEVDFYFQLPPFPGEE